jgi:hypothetical protein
MPHAIIRGKNGRRHEVDFGDEAVRVEIHSAKRPSRFLSSQTSRCSPRGVDALLFSTSPATCLAKPPPQRRDVPRSLPLRDLGNCAKLTGARSTIESKRSL